MERRVASSANGTLGNESSEELIGTVRELITMMSKGGITELDLSTGDLSIRLRGNHAVPAGSSVPGTGAADSAQHASAGEEGFEITAPMIGTYYSAPSPGEAPFVHVGDDVEVGQVVGIIEAMKIMNEIVSDRAGVVLEVLVENAQAVEYGSPLIRLGEPTDAIA
jgi:acetyl-CoA carboxylase biotin carboxyl carrier protein